MITSMMNSPCSESQLSALEGHIHAGRFSEAQNFVANFSSSTSILQQARIQQAILFALRSILQRRCCLQKRLARNCSMHTIASFAGDTLQQAPIVNSLIQNEEFQHLCRKWLAAAPEIEAEEFVAFLHCVPLSAAIKRSAVVQRVCLNCISQLLIKRRYDDVSAIVHSVPILDSEERERVLLKLISRQKTLAGVEELLALAKA